MTARDAPSVRGGRRRLVIEPQFSDPELQAIFERQHRYCRQCHPELGRDWLRAGTWGAVLSGTLALWVLFITWLADRG